MRVVPSSSMREPSSLVRRKTYWPVVGAVRVAVAWLRKLSSWPNCSAVVQSMVGMTLSTLGVVPSLSVHREVRGPVL